MKTLDFKSYSEKLNINPIMISDLDKTGLKSMLLPFDIVEFTNGDYFVFMKGKEAVHILKTALNYSFSFPSDYDKEITDIGRLYASSDGKRMFHISMSNYDSDLICSAYKEDYTIKKIWHAKDNLNATKAFDSEQAFTLNRLHELLKSNLYEKDYIENENI